MSIKSRETSKSMSTSMYSKKRRVSPLMIIGMAVPALLILIAGVIFVLPRLTSSHAAADNMNCSLQVPRAPLTAQGLATPYLLFATNAGNGPCHEANAAAQSAFVQASILDPATGKVSVYNPLVIDRGTKPAIVPTAPTLPANAIVGIWFGFNGTVLQLRGDVAGGRCVNGSRGSNFGQFAYCNAPAFFQAANAAIKGGTLIIPPVGMAKDGKPCLTVRDFGIVDMDQSDNVQTQYLTTANGQIAQLSAANQAKLQNTTVIGNPSDNALVSKIMDPLLGCTPATAPDLTDNSNLVPALALDELQAAAFQVAPIALVPPGDPMVLNNNQQQSLRKTNAYRLGVDQTPAASLNAASTTTYCQNLVNMGPARLTLDQQLTQNAASPMPAVANSLFTFLAQRLNMAIGAGGLNCVGLLKIQNPITLTADGNGVFIAATVAGAATTPGGTTPGTTPVVNPVTTPVVNPVTTPVVNPGTTPVVNPVTTPVVNPGTTPVVNPVTTPVVNPVTTPVANPVTTPVVNPVTTPVATP